MSITFATSVLSTRISAHAPAGPISYFNTKKSCCGFWKMATALVVSLLLHAGDRDAKLVPSFALLRMHRRLSFTIKMTGLASVISAMLCPSFGWSANSVAKKVHLIYVCFIPNST